MSPDLVLRLLYGGIIIAGFFLVGAMLYLTVKELLRIGWRAAVRSLYFWLVMLIAGQAVAIAAICAMRLADSFAGFETQWGWLLVAAFSLLMVTKIGFNYAGSMVVHNGKIIWRAFLAGIFLWSTIVIATWTR